MTVEVSVWLTVGCPELSPGACCSSSWWRSRLLPGRDLLSRTDDQTWSCDRYSQHHSHPYRGSDGGKETEGGKDRNQKRWWVLIWFSRTSRGFWFWFVTFFEWRFFKDQAQKTQKKQHSLCPWIAFFQFSLLKWGGTYPKRRCHTHQLAFSFRALVPWRSDRGVRGFFLVIPGWQEERTRRELTRFIYISTSDRRMKIQLHHYSTFTRIQPLHCFDQENTAFTHTLYPSLSFISFLSDCLSAFISYILLKLHLALVLEWHYLSVRENRKPTHTHTLTLETCVCVVFGSGTCVSSFLDEIKGILIHFGTSSCRGLEGNIDSSLIFVW